MTMDYARRVVAVGELLWDMLPGGPRLGGTTTNFAIGIARLGLPSTLVTCLGDDDAGKLAKSELEQRAHSIDFDMSQIQVSTCLPTGTVDVTLDANESPSYQIVFPVAWDAIVQTASSHEVARTAQAICFGTLAQRGDTSRASIRRLIEVVPSDCVRVLDVNARLPFCSPEVVRWSIANATIVKISEEELSLVTEYLHVPDKTAETYDLATLIEIVHSILQTAPECHLIAITLGARGSLLVTREASDYHAGYPVTVIDTVGAGDAFTSGMTAAYLQGAALPVINTVGNLCGSFVASQPGATPALPAALLARIGDLLST